MRPATLSWRTIRVSWLTGLLALGVPMSGCSGQGGVARAGYDKIAGGMSRAAVDQALAELGSAQPSSANEALTPPQTGKGPPRKGPSDRARKIWDTLTVVKYGPPNDSVFVGFDAAGKARAKALRVAGVVSSEWRQQTISAAPPPGGQTPPDD